MHCITTYRKRLLSKVACLDISKVNDAIFDRDVEIWADARSSQCQVQRARWTVQVERFLKLVKPTENVDLWNSHLDAQTTGTSVW